MKKAMILRAIMLILIAAFTMTACTITAGTDETPKPVETVVPAFTPAPAETPAATEPTQEPALTPVAGDIPGIDYSKSPYANADALIAEYGWASTQQDRPRIFVYSTYSYPDDWNINPDMPLSLYKYVYNIEAENRYTNASLFRTNKETLAEKPIEIINAVIKEATEYHNDVQIGLDYRNLNSFSKASRKHLGPTQETEAYIEDIVKYAKDMETVQYAAFITDPSLVYIDIDNSIRVRGAQMTYIDQSRQTEEKLGMKKKTWIYGEIEYIMRPTQEVAETLGIKVWRDEPYTVYDIADLFPTPREATPEEIALMERTVGNPMK